MQINWKVRVKKLSFWTALISAILLLTQQVLAVFGYQIDIVGIEQQLTGIVGTVFVILTIIGVVVDPTTKGVSDSKQAMRYNDPKDDNFYVK